MNSNSNALSSDVPAFSHQEYRMILSRLKEYLPILDYSEVTENVNRFCVIRHDVEFSLERALDLAQIEHDMDIQTSYFIQLGNNTYNAISKKSLDILRKINNLGHKIGLHFTPTSSEEEVVYQEFIALKTILDSRLDIDIDRFSFHRPNLNRKLISSNIRINGVINAYDKLYFEYFDDTIPENPDIKYISDSNHQWKYGHPIDVVSGSCSKVQVLIHPFSWSKNGGDNLANYVSLLKEKNNVLMDSINAEISNFPKDDLKNIISLQ